MAKYRITYLDHQPETLEADSAEYDADARMYVLGRGARVIALIPDANVLSVVRVVRVDETATTNTEET